MISICYRSEYSDLRSVFPLLFLSSTLPVYSRGCERVLAVLTDLVSFVILIKSETINIDDIESNARLRVRQAADACDTPCSWITQTTTCNNVACDCQLCTRNRCIGVASCANCLQPINTTLASQAVQIGEYCGVTQQCHHCLNSNYNSYSDLSCNWRYHHIYYFICTNFHHNPRSNAEY